jgi:hypothetical protein
VASHHFGVVQFDNSCLSLYLFAKDVLEEFNI